VKNKILEDLKNAMKAQDKEKLSVIRSVKGALQLEEINKKKELSDDEVIAVIGKQIKMRKDSIEEFKKGNRLDLIEQYQKEIEILNVYMPEQLKEEEIIEIIDEAFSSINPTSSSDMGKIMGAVMPKLKGKADMSFVNKIIKDRLNNL